MQFATSQSPEMSGLFWQYLGDFWPYLSHSKPDFDVKSEVDLWFSTQLIQPN